MATEFDSEDLSELEAKETSRKLPVGWLLLFWGLVLWGIYYLWAYTPGLGGWSQVQDLEGAATSSGVNVFATVLFTALATIVAVAILLTLARRKKA